MRLKAMFNIWTHILILWKDSDRVSKNYI